ncbi:MAG: hypothetical protein PHE17_03070 [Thiothrix sp.]|uniref:hypothetical protein n=1 Tax=Thiothrix sp. TaxID=1032 RepID=UPI00260DEE35|nr:hypothetical protein [Thiothrix sp.]MDD5391980.1 hypothetical protein [Thiothrix sp.]
MSIFAICTMVAIQAALITHLIRKHRRLYWLPVIVCPPGIGCVAYVFTQVLPDVEF